MLATTANFSSSIFARAPRNPIFGAFFGVQVRAMGSDKANAKLRRVEGNKIAMNGEKKEMDISIKDDLTRLEDMKVDEIRARLRQLGASPKGRKPELISSLKKLLNEIHGKAGGESSESSDGETEMSQETNTIFDETISKKRLLADNGVLEEVKDETAAMIEISVTNKAELPVAGKRSSSKRKLAAETSSKEVKVYAASEDSKITNEPWITFAHKKPQKGWAVYNPRTMRPPPLDRDVKAVKIMSWNVNGLRALLKTKGFSAVELAARDDFDVLCLQETKIQDKDVKAVKDMLEGYEHEFWTCSTSRLGYSGTAIISRIKPVSVKYGLGISDHDSEGRLVTVEFDSFYLLNAYVPNSGDGLKRLSYRVTEWDAALSSYMKELEKSKPVILTGDLNCAHQEIDIYNPAGNRKSAGFTDEERQSFEKCYLSNGFYDTFRKQHPDAVGYTYWGYRHGGRKTNRGWRLDYFLVSQSIADNIHDSFILPDINGSDHCPIGLILKL